VNPLPLLLALLLAADLSGQPRMVRDINLHPRPVGSSAFGYATVGNVTFFTAWTPEHGNELWKTDGTADGTVLVRDINPGPKDTIGLVRGPAAVVGNRLVFVARDSVHGLECWSSDGTSDGTVLLADAAPGSANSHAAFGPVIGRYLYYSAYHPDTGVELWRTDGTPAGTGVAVDLHPGFLDSSPRLLGAAGPLLLLRATDGQQTGIFTTDGTAAGTRFVAPFEGVSGTALGEEALFTSPDGADRWKLMKTDGTAGGTTIVREGLRGDATRSFRVAGRVAYFVADDGTTGDEVWRTDGTPAGTYALDVAAGPVGSQPFGLMPFAERLLFTTPERLYVTDGTPGGTRVVKDVPGAAAGRVSGSHYYFAWDDCIHGRELWKSDGTAEGTALVADVLPGPQGGTGTRLVAREGGVFFPGYTHDVGEEPWVSDGTRAGTRLLTNAAPDHTLGSDPAALAEAGGRLFFTAMEGERATIWSSDATEAGTLRVPGRMEWAAGMRGVGSGNLYYFSIPGPLGRELWRTDGTAAGTFLLAHLADQGSVLLPLRGGLLFQGLDLRHGTEPWFTDGTVAGTHMVADLIPGPEGSFAYGGGAAVAGGFAYFNNWRTDGTAAGTRQLDSERSSYGFTRLGDAVFFFSSTSYPEERAQLWKSDLATGHTERLFLFDGRAPEKLWSTGGLLFFVLDGRVWRSDGTASGTRSVAGLDAEDGLVCGRDYAAGNGLFFWHSRNALWRSDGTEAGTIRLATFRDHCQPRELYFAAGRLFFAAGELWASDGTVAGTGFLYDVNGTDETSRPGSFLAVGDTLYFAAHDIRTGQELWAMPLRCGEACAPRRRSVRSR
jgi:ELWxxDGT repeat protein